MSRVMLAPHKHKASDIVETKDDYLLPYLRSLHDPSKIERAIIEGSEPLPEGTAFPLEPYEYQFFRLTQDITGYPAALYRYDGEIDDWVRLQPVHFEGTSEPTGIDFIIGDTFWNTTESKGYKWNGTTWVFTETSTHGSLGGISDDDHHAKFTSGDHAAVEHVASMLSIESRPWVTNFNVSWDSATPDYNKLYYGKAGAESTTDADIEFADGTTDLINQKTEDGVPDGLWYLYWDESFKTGGDYDVKRTNDILVAVGSGKGLLATMVVDNAGSKPPAIVPWGGYKPYVSAGVMATKFITSGMLVSEFIIGEVEIKTGAGVVWGGGSGNPGVIMTDLGIRGKGASGVTMFEALASDGKLSAGGGNVVLDSGGLKILGQAMYLLDSAEALRGWLWGTTTYLQLASNNADLKFTTSAGKSIELAVAGDSVKFNPSGDIEIASAFDAIRPTSDKGLELGTPSYTMPHYLPRYTSKPTPGAGYLGMTIVVRSGAGIKSKVYVCVLNDADAYEWLQIGVST